MNYYILKDNDVIQEGDQYAVGDGWSICTNSVGYKNLVYQESYCQPHWQVRRPIKKTKLGNVL